MEATGKRVTRVLGAVGIIAGLGLGAAGLASAASSPGGTGSTTAEAKDVPDQNPNIQAGSIQVPENGEQNDATEAANLKALAKVSPDEAQRAALVAVPGTAKKVELENENGVVYSVDVSANGTTIDVKVDAGTGKVLGQENAEEHGDQQSGPETPDANGQND